MSSGMTNTPSPKDRDNNEQDQFLTILSREDALARFEAALFPRAMREREAPARRRTRLRARRGRRRADRRAAVRPLQCRWLCGAFRRSRCCRRGVAGPRDAERRGDRLRHRADAAGIVGNGHVDRDRRSGAARGGRRRHGRAYAAGGTSRDRNPPRRFARTIRVLCRFRYRPRRGAAARRHRHRLARDRHAGGLRHRAGDRRAPAARRHHLHRRRTGAARPAAAPGRDLRHQRRDRHGGDLGERRRGAFSRRHPRRRSATRIRDAQGAGSQRHAGAVRRHVQGRGRRVPSHHRPARQARHHRPWRGAEARQAAVPCGVRRQACRSSCRDFRPRRCSPSTT